MKKKLENFWYHYKWTTIVVAFFATVVVIGVVQMLTRTEYDAQIVYAGPVITVIDSGSDVRIASAFGSLLTKDRDGDGKINILLNAKTIISDEQLSQKQEEAEKEHDHVAYDVALRQESMQEISTLLLTGQVSICLFDPYVYGRFPADAHFVPLAEILDEVPEAAVDEYAVRLKGTDFGRQIAFSSLPDDTLICLHIQVNDSKSVAENYEYCLELFKAAMSFSPGS